VAQTTHLPARIATVGLRETYTLVQSVTGTDEETSADGAAYGNHVQVAALHGPVKFDNAETIIALLERGQVEAISRHEILILDRLGRLLGATCRVVGWEYGRVRRRRDDGGLLRVRSWGAHGEGESATTSSREYRM